MVFGWGTFGTVLFWSLLVVVIGGGIIGTLIWFLWRKSYNQKAILWSKTGGVPQKIATYPAKWIGIGKAGDRLMFIRGAKKWQLPTIRSGRNEWNFWVRERDGEWVNFGLEDLDEKMEKMGTKHIDGDVRMQRLGIEKVLKERHQGKRDWASILANISYIVFFILVFIALVVLFSKLVDVVEAQEKASQSINNMAQAVNNFYTNKVDGISPQDIEEGGGILVPVGDG